MEYIQLQKQKFSENVDGEIDGVDSKMLKVAQDLDRDIRMNKVFSQEDDDEDNED